MNMTKMEGYGYGRYDAGRLDEGFDLSGSDVDYTDTFSDMDQDAELISEFAKGLMPALWVQDCAGKRRFAGQLDPVARSWGKLTSVEDPMLALIGCCVIDGNGDGQHRAQRHPRKGRVLARVPAVRPGDRPCRQ